MSGHHFGWLAMNSVAATSHPPLGRSLRYRSHEVLAQAVQLCGREISPGRYRLSMSQRALARELDMSITNLRRHLQQAGDQVISLKPLCVQLHGTTATSSLHVSTASQPIVGDRLHVVTETSSGLSATELATELLRCAATMHTTAAALMERAAALLTLEPVIHNHMDHVEPARYAPVQPDEQGAKRAVLAQVSQSDLSPLPKQKNSDCLTSTNHPARANPARNAPGPNLRALTREIKLSDDEVAKLIEPLTRWCTKTNNPSVDPAGLRRLSTFTATELQAGVAHTLNQVKAQPNIRRAFGLLINMLTNGEIPTTPTPTPAPTAAIELVTPQDPELWALAKLCATGTAFWETHIAPLYPDITGRCPTGEVARTARIYATFTEQPLIATTALDWITTRPTTP
jgi:hypothetical protein